MSAGTELTALRARDRRVVDNGDGTHTAVFQHGLHHLRSGIWTPNDATWDDTGTVLRPRLLGFGLEFDKASRALSLSFPGETEAIVLIPLNPRTPKVTRAGNRILLAGLWRGIDLALTLMPEGVKAEYTRTSATYTNPSWMVRGPFSKYVKPCFYADPSSRIVPVPTGLVDGVYTIDMSSVAVGVTVDPTVTVTLSTESDDVMLRLGAVEYYDTTGAGVNPAAGKYDASNYQYGAGFRFPGITVPAGSTVDTATLTLTATALAGTPSPLATNVRAKVQAEMTDNAATWPAAAADFKARYVNRTTASVAWNPSAWATDTSYASPELRTVVQEVVSRGGWTSGNGLALFWHDWDNEAAGVGLCLVNDAGDAVSASRPKLAITYTAPPPSRFAIGARIW